jgi:hypothetical protein
MPYVRTKAKGTTVITDLHEVTNKWVEIPDGEWRSAYDDPNVERRDEKKDDKATTVTEET